MSTRFRLGLVTALVVLLALVAFEAVFYLEVLADGDPSDNYLITERAPRAIVLGALAAGSAALLAGWLGGRVLRGLSSIVSTAADMTDRGDFSRRLAQDTRDRESAELTRTFNRLIDHVDRVLRAQRQLVADTSHELRTPLTTISGNLEFLARNLPEAERAEVLVETREEVRRLSRLVNDLLLLAEIGEKVAPDRVPVPLDSLVESEVARLPAAQAGRVHVEHEPLVVSGDEERLGQIIRNLLQNALRYASPAPGAVHVSLTRDGAYARLVVEDDGPGIPADALERVFDRFSRLDNARSRMRGGFGLGLAIVRHVAEAHGGRAFASNRAEGGARFTVLLPAEPSWLDLDAAGYRYQSGPAPSSRGARWPFLNSRGQAADSHGPFICGSSRRGRLDHHDTLPTLYSG
jgi:signal transduction histidine kinase